MADHKACDKQGYHQFFHGMRDDDHFGSFEVFWDDEEIVRTLNGDGYPGWYWVARFPGHASDCDYRGPFATSQEAYDNAQERA